MRLPRFRIRTLMIVIVVVACLTAGGMFIIASVGESRAHAECRNNLKLISLAIHNYNSVYDEFPPGTVPNPALPPSRRLSWIVTLGNFLDQGLSFIIDLLSPWDSPANSVPLFRITSTDGTPPPYTTSAAAPQFLQCPVHRSRPPARGVQPSDYIGIAGLGTDAPTLPLGHPRTGVFGDDRQTRLQDIKDGTSHTMMLAETSAALGPWTAGGPPTMRGLDPSRRPYIGRGRQLGGLHRRGAMVAMVDGSVRFVHEAVDPAILEAASTIAGGEPHPMVCE